MTAATATLCLLAAAGVPDRGAEAGLELTTINAAIVLTADDHKFREFLGSFDALGVEHRISAAHVLADYFRQAATVDGARRGTGRHRLDLVAGRAATAFESALGVELPAVESATTANLLDVQQRARWLLDAYRAGAVAAERGSRIGLTTEQARAKYRPRFARLYDRDDPDLSLEHYKAFEELVGEWFSIGKPFDDLATIVGDPGIRRAEKGAVDYVISNGVAGGAYRVYVRDGTIVGFIRVYIL